jgi:predicted transcriptional regulator
VTIAATTRLKTAARRRSRLVRDQAEVAAFTAQAVRDARDEGMSLSAIAAFLGVSHQAVAQMLAKDES